MAEFCETCHLEMTGWCNQCDEPYCEDCDGRCMSAFHEVPYDG